MGLYDVCVVVAFPVVSRGAPITGVWCVWARPWLCLPGFPYLIIPPTVCSAISMHIIVICPYIYVCMSNLSIYGGWVAYWVCWFAASVVQRQPPEQAG